MCAGRKWLRNDFVLREDSSAKATKSRSTIYSIIVHLKMYMMIKRIWTLRNFTGMLLNIDFSKTNLFNYISDPKSISKKVILSMIHDEF